MPESVSKYSIARDYDPNGERLSADSDPREAFLTYVDEIHGGAIGDMGFTLQHFRDYIDELRKRRELREMPIEEFLERLESRDVTIPGRCIGIVGMKPPRK